MPDIRHWTVTTSNERPIAEVTQALSKAGFKIDQVLDEIGVVSGRGTPAAIAKLRRLRGIADISPVVSVDVGPPDSPHTW